MLLLNPKSRSSKKVPFVILLFFKQLSFKGCAIVKQKFPEWEKVKRLKEKVKRLKEKG